MNVVLHLVVLLVFPPLMVGVITRTKAIIAGRTGPPLLQPYWDLLRLLRKGAVYSRSTTWIFRAGPVVSLATVITAGLLIPLVGDRAPLGFAGDLVAFAYLLALGRFFTVAAALDTGSSLEGMGGSRDATFGALAEPALFLALALVAVHADAVSFHDAFGRLTLDTWARHAPALVLGCLALGSVLLAENARIPVDDPATHLELTMVHEVMVLDHSGPDLAFILYGRAVKLFLFGALFLHTALPVHAAGDAAAVLALCAGQLGVGVAIGAIESGMARLRLPRVPHFLLRASVLAALAIVVLHARGNR